MKKKKWKRTLGERLMQIPGPEPLPNGYEELWWDERLKARRIDAAIRRAVREAVKWTWEEGRAYEDTACGRNYSPSVAKNIKARIERKYGVRL